ncbi:peptidase [Alkalicaulis satelles]|uniref:Peptidase n=1 Tax=Alkalicaulis satelles TaxID=2609175 RepID=A0A5M6ZIN8_9PROT|nr:M14 family zinc carboxypeptidase [Alkalicaulis satelles]KAA5804692.1 peptidase [Alkalicaulis satelles]
MIKTWRAALTALTAIAFATPAALAEPASFFQVEGVEYDPAVTVFEDHAGYEIGERVVGYEDLLGYVRYLAQASDRLIVNEIGRSHQGRPILKFTITSPENHARLDEIRAAHLARLRGDAPADAAPIVVWINYGVHGAETSSMDAAIPFLHHFAAARGEEIEETLANTVILATVTHNPDGHARRIDHVERFSSRVPVTDPAHEIHNLWGLARVNHYGFDLNRQWLLLTQPEAVAITTAWQSWKPMVTGDYHEMGHNSPYYFHPGVETRRNPLINVRARELTYEIARRHAAFMDSEARLYATQEVFDNFYIGKGSTYPQLSGSLGILFEAGAARGGQIMSEHGLVTNADNVRTQFRTALTTVQGALDIRDDLIAFQRDFFAENARQAARANAQAWVFTAPGDPERARRFVRLLRTHDIEVYAAARDIRASRGAYRAGESFIVPARQLQHRLIRGIFERFTEFEENVFYDVSGWTLPLAYNLQYDALPGGMFSPLPLGDLAEGAFQSAPAPDRAPYGYVFDWSHTFAPRALNRVLEAGLMARAAREPFTLVTTQGDREFGRGSVFVPLARQDQTPSQIHALMETIAREDGVPVAAAATGLTRNIGRDLGAWTVFRTLTAPKVVIAFDDGISWNDAGEMWWTLDHQHEMAVLLVPASRLARLDWTNYTHLILPGGNPSMDDATKDILSRWVRSGGTVIGARQGAQWAERRLLDIEAPEPARPENDSPLRLDFNQMQVRDAEHILAGAIFETDLDVTHPIGWGYGARKLPVNRNTAFTLTRPDDPFATPVQYAQNPLLSGYASRHRLEEIAGTPAVTVRRQGRGSVILFADNPVFRATYPGTERLLMNAIFFSSVMDGSRGLYEDEAELN